MSRIADCFAKLQQQNQAALVTFVTAGDPDYQTSLSLLKQLPLAGADIIELGMPFTDPMADGPTIQKSALRALANGQTLAKTLQMVSDFRQHDSETPIVLMGYFNPIHHYGVNDFVGDAKTAGVDGLIIVDLPAEHDADLCTPAKEVGIDFIRLTTPTTDSKRLPQVLANTSGFIYYVSVAGVTGAGSATEQQIAEAVKQLKNKTSLPVCVGFGIRSPEQAATVARLTDGVVVGSAFVNQIELASSSEQAIKDVVTLCQELSNSVKKAR